MIDEALGALRDHRQMEELERLCARSPKARERLRFALSALQGVLSRVTYEPVQPSWLDLLIDGGDWRSCYPWGQLQRCSARHPPRS